MQIQRVNIIGSGNVATHLATSLARSYNIIHVFSRQADHANKLAEATHSRAISDLSMLSTEADLNIVSVSDSAIPEILEMLPVKTPVVITAGTVDIEILEKFEAGGVFYPLQTFTKGRIINISEVPFLVESKNTGFEKNLIDFAFSAFSAQGYRMNSEKRKIVHLAAVTASNFSNYLLSVSQDILSKEGISPDILKPLLVETVAKAFDLGAAKAQTGPAVRGDLNVVMQQLNMLGDKEFAKIYRAISEQINPDLFR